MQVKVNHPKATEAIISIEPSADELSAIKKQVLRHFQTQVKVPGFREGKTPLELVEKHVDQNMLQSRFLDEAIDQLYRQAMVSENLRPVDRPNVTLKKFVPFTTLEFDVTVQVIGDIKLADYKKISLPRPKISLTAKDINDVLSSLQLRMSEKKDVDRAAKTGDQVYIDFSGVDAKGQAVKGADGKDYPIILGSNTFIPGFEDELIGLKANDKKEFTLNFPKDYGVKALAGSKITFNVTVTKVQEVMLPKLDDEFAKKVGPFKTLAELKEDIKKQVSLERQNEADRQYESELIKLITNKSQVDAPEVLVAEQVERMVSSERQNAIYRGTTWEEYLKAQDLDEEKFKKSLQPIATERVKASLVLSEIADAEKVDLTPEELNQKIEDLKIQYKDPQMQEQLATDQARQDIASRLLTEKTIKKLVGYAGSK